MKNLWIRKKKKSQYQIQAGNLSGFHGCDEIHDVLTSCMSKGSVPFGYKVYPSCSINTWISLTLHSKDDLDQYQISSQLRGKIRERSLISWEAIENATPISNISFDVDLNSICKLQGSTFEEEKRSYELMNPKVQFCCVSSGMTILNFFFDSINIKTLSEGCDTPRARPV